MTIIFDDYQKWTDKVSIYPGKGADEGLMYAALGFVGEVNELEQDGHHLTASELQDELGDCFFYLARLMEEAGFDRSDLDQTDFLLATSIRSIAAAVAQDVKKLWRGGATEARIEKLRQSLSLAAAHLSNRAWAFSADDEERVAVAVVLEANMAKLEERFKEGTIATSGKKADEIA